MRSGHETTEMCMLQLTHALNLCNPAAGVRGCKSSSYLLKAENRCLLRRWRKSSSLYGVEGEGVGEGGRTRGGGYADCIRKCTKCVSTTSYSICKLNCDGNTARIVLTCTEYLVKHVRPQISPYLLHLSGCLSGQQLPCGIKEGPSHHESDYPSPHATQGSKHNWIHAPKVESSIHLWCAMEEWLLPLLWQCPWEINFPTQSDLMTLRN